MSQLKHALRQLVLRPALSATVIAMLAVGVGSTTAIYSLIHYTILRPIEAPAVDELVSFRSPGQKFGTTRGDLVVGSDRQRLFSYPMYRSLGAEQDVFTGIAAHYVFLASMEIGEDTTRLANAVLVSGNYFSVLNLRPALGRFIDPQDAQLVGESRVAVLSYRHWQNNFAGDPDVVGRTLTINNQELTIIGVAPEAFAGTMRDFDPLVYVPLTLRWLMQPEEPRNEENVQAYWLTLFARLNPGVSRDRAQAEMDGLYRSVLREEAPLLTGVTEEQRALYLEGRLELDPGARGQVYTQVRATDGMTLAFGATMLVLLIACVNVANLLLARGASRVGEMAIRASLGANRGRLVTQLLAEATVLAGIGGVLAFPVALATLQVIQAVAGGAPAELGLVLNPPVVLFAAAVTLATVVVFGLVPALSAGRTDTASVIKAQSARSSGGRGLARFRSAFVALQIALSLVLLVLAGLFTRSLVNVSRIDYGMDVDSMVSFSVTPLLGGYSGERLDALYERVREGVAAQPGVEAVGTVAFPLFYGIDLPIGISVLGAEEQVADSVAQGNPAVGPGFFAAASIPLRAGRDFTAADSTPSPSVVIVNESFVRKFGLGGDAVGTTLRLDGRFVPQGVVEIVGVVADAKYNRIREDIEPQIFAPQVPGDARFVALFYYVRTSVPPDALLRVIPDVVNRIDPNIPASNLQTLRSQIDVNTRFDRVMSTLSATFAGLATVLAAIGLYAVLAFSVAQRKRELGLRLALGADAKQLRSLVLAQVARLAVIGGSVGLIGAFAVGRLAEARLFALSGDDPAVFAAAIGGLAIVVLVASWVPALRASKVAPMEALRYE